MKRSLLLLASLAVATPASAQSSTDLAAVLTEWGYPANALTVFAGTEADARRVLGEPTQEDTYPEEPDYRLLSYSLAAGVRLSLKPCTDAERERRDLDDSRVFCEMMLTRSFSSDREMRTNTRSALDALDALTKHTFRACDTTYYVFADVVVHAEGMAGEGWPTALVVEPAWPALRADR